MTRKVVDLPAPPIPFLSFFQCPNGAVECVPEGYDLVRAADVILTVDSRTGDQAFVYASESFDRQATMELDRGRSSGFNVVAIEVDASDRGEIFTVLEFVKKVKGPSNGVPPDFLASLVPAMRPFDVPEFGIRLVPLKDLYRARRGRRKITPKGRHLLRDATVVSAYDINTQQRYPICGINRMRVVEVHAFLTDGRCAVAEGFGYQGLLVQLDAESSDLGILLDLVTQIKGGHDYAIE